MQTQTEIRQLLAEAGLAPNKALGQNFLIDGNLMRKLLELAEVGAGETVLEVGPGTGSLTEELAAVAGRVVAVELDRGLSELLARRLGGMSNVRILHADALAGKRRIEPAVIDAVRPRARLVSNLPYNAATPLVAECLLMSHKAIGTSEKPPQARRGSCPAAANSGQEGPNRGGTEPHRASSQAADPLCLFDRLTFTVQQEVADRMAAGPGSEAYGPLSVIVSLLSAVTQGPAIPASAFWPRPRVASRMLRIDFDPRAASRLADAAVLSTLLKAAFARRRKQIGSLPGRSDCPFDAGDLAAAFERAGARKRLRAEEISPQQYLQITNSLRPPALSAAGLLSRRE